MFRFRLFNIPFEVGPMFWLGSAILGGGVAYGPNAVALLAIWVACAFLSIVVHELGHAIVAKSLGHMTVVELHAIGGVTRMFGRPLSRAEGLWVSLAGPAAGFGLFLLVTAVQPILFGALRSHGFFEDKGAPGVVIVEGVFTFMLWINWVWTIFNLLPILPLDGGQVVRNILGPKHLFLANVLGAVCAIAVACWAVLVAHQLYLALFMGYLAFMNVQGSARSLPGGIRQ